MGSVEVLFQPGNLAETTEMTVSSPSARAIQTAWPSRTMPVSELFTESNRLVRRIRSGDLWTVLETHTLQAIWGETAISAAANMSDQFKVVSATLQQ